jgi:xanthine dehydrogenase accessory factor
VPFVHAHVVLAEAPTSARPGDEAIVTGDGTVFGFVGGTCAEATVREQALALLGGGAGGPTTLLRITPTAANSETQTAQPGKQVVHNPCLSGGTVEVFLEVELPPRLVMVAGRAPIAAALTSLGARAGFEMRAYSPGASLPPDTTAVVVASHGAGEEDLLLAALDADVSYVGLVASQRRGAAVVGALPVSDEVKARVRTPAGLDIGARTPEEVALSILAEIVASRPRAGRGAATVTPATATAASDDGPAGFATDPVCGMLVPIAAETLHLRHDGAEVWFCGPGCRQAFAAEPASYHRD